MLKKLGRRIVGHFCLKAESPTASRVGRARPGLLTHLVTEGSSALTRKATFSFPCNTVMTVLYSLLSSHWKGGEGGSGPVREDSPMQEVVQAHFAGQRVVLPSQFHGPNTGLVARTLVMSYHLNHGDSFDPQ